MILGRAGIFGSIKLAHLVWKARFFTVPYALAPGGGGPGDSLTSTDTPIDWSDPHYRGYRPTYGY